MISVDLEKHLLKRSLGAAVLIYVFDIGGFLLPVCVTMFGVSVTNGLHNLVLQLRDLQFGG